MKIYGGVQRGNRPPATVRVSLSRLGWRRWYFQARRACRIAFAAGQSSARGK